MIMPRKVLPRIAAVSAAEKPYTLHISWERGREDVVDLSALIEAFRVYAPLRQAPKLFQAVQLGEYGTDVVWTEDIDMAASTLWRLAQEQSGATMTAEADRHEQMFILFRITKWYNIFMSITKTESMK
jgi:hypothetical protein